MELLRESAFAKEQKSRIWQQLQMGSRNSIFLFHEPFVLLSEDGGEAGSPGFPPPPGPPLGPPGPPGPPAPPGLNAGAVQGIADRLAAGGVPAAMGGPPAPGSPDAPPLSSGPEGNFKGVYSCV